MVGAAAMLRKGNRAWATPLHHVLFPEKSEAWVLLNSGSAVALCSVLMATALTPRKSKPGGAHVGRTFPVQYTHGCSQL